MSRCIASVQLYGQRPGKRRFKITVEIGEPYRVSAKPEEWACPVSVRPLYSKLGDIHGEDSFQALCLAAALAQELLNGFCEEGGLLSYSTGGSFPLEAYAFGIARRNT